MKRIIYFILSATIIAMTMGCRDEQESTISPVSLIKALPGHNRSLIEFAVPEGAVSGRVFYGVGEYLDFTIDKSAENQKIMVSKLPEGEQVLRVVTYGASGNCSDPKGVRVMVYGNQYLSKLENRTLLTLKRESPTSIIINFDRNKREDELGVRVFFVNKSGSNDSVFIDRSLNSVRVNNIDLDKPYYFSTVYKPDPACMDEFQSARIDAKEASMKIFAKDSWTIAGASGELTGKEGVRIFDNNILTDWQSKPTAMPQWVAIDMQLEKIFSGFSIVQSQDPKDIDNFGKGFRIEVSKDNINWTTVKEGRLKACCYKQTFMLEKPVVARYFKITILNAYGAGTTTAQIAEIDLFNDLRGSGNNGAAIPSLKNATTPFKGDGSDIFPNVGAGRMQKLDSWTHTSNVMISFDNSVKQFSPWCAPAWGLAPVNNGKIYQTIELKPGKYVLTVDVGGVSSPNCAELYGVVAAGTELPDYAEVTTAPQTLGQEKLTDHLVSKRDIPFTVKETSKVTVGTVFNLYNTYPGSGVPWTTINIGSFRISAQ